MRTVAFFCATVAADAADVLLAHVGLPSMNGIDARLELTPHLKVAFSKMGSCRRLLYLRAEAAGRLASVKAIALQYRLQLVELARPRLAVVVFDSDGESWIKVARLVAPSATLSDARVSLAALRPTDFSPRANGKVDWQEAQRVWLGIVLDGPAEGTLEIRSPRLTDEPSRPTEPLLLTADGARQWTMHRDKAVQSRLTTSDGGPGGQACMRAEFSFPGGRHMFCTNSLSVPFDDLEGYRALRITYRAELPPGISGMLVLLSERSGACYLAEPSLPASAAWQTVTIPLDRFRLAAWSKDADSRLGMEEVTRVWVGAHGSATGDGGSGSISVCNMALVP